MGIRVEIADGGNQSDRDTTWFYNVRSVIENSTVKIYLLIFACLTTM